MLGPYSKIVLKIALPLLLVCLAGCPAPPRPRYGVDHKGMAQRVTDPDDLLRRVRQINTGYAELKTVHEVTIVITPDENREEKRFVRGVLAVRRPDLFRLVLLGPGGIKLMDILYGAGRHKVLHLAPTLDRSSLLPTIIASLCQDIRAMYDLAPSPFVTRRAVEETVASASGNTPLYDLKEYRRGTIVRRMTIFASTLAISRVHEVDDRGDSRTITFGDYETDGRVLVPRSFHVARTGKLDYWLMIRVKEVTLDEGLDDRLFQS